MHPADKALVIGRYQERFKTFGSDFRTLASGTRERQQIRFEVLEGIGIRSGDSVLDLGCGFGDFFDFLLQRGLEVEYVGYDLCPELVEVARQRFPAAHFEVRDIQEAGIPRRFDYITASQVFNTRLQQEDNVAFVQRILRQAYDASEKGVAIDLLSTYVDYREPDLYYYAPEQLFAFAKTLSKRVCVRHDYPLFEFMLYLYKDFAGWQPQGSAA